MGKYMLDRRIKVRHIQCFVEIARERSLKAAADKLFLTQPAISKTLKELEEIIGATLMQRSRAGVELTGQGDVFLHFAQMSLASLEQGLIGVERATHRQTERLTLGALPSVAASLMPGVVAGFAERAPNATLRIMDGSHGYLTDRLKLGELDLVIGRLGAPDTMQGITFEQLYSEQVEFVVRAGHPLVDQPDLRRIVDWQVIYPPENAAIRPLVERYLIANGIGEIPNVLETVSGAFGRVYTRNSDAVWIISRGVVTNELAEGRLVRLPFDTGITRGPVGLMRRPGEETPPVQQAFRLALKAEIGRAGLLP